MAPPQHGVLEMIVGPKQIPAVRFGETLVIGRDPASCHLALEDNRISALHCRIEVQRGQFMLIDLGSANGTFVNDERATRKPLSDGDLLKLGDYVLIFNLASGAAPKLQAVAPAGEAEVVERTFAPHRETRAMARQGGAPPAARAAPAAPAAPAPVFAEGKRFGRFEITGEIGRGGMGVIYRVKDIKSKAGKVYALKALPGGAYAAREVVERFIDEARALQRIKVDGVVRIYQIAEEQGTPFYVMDYIDGETLEDRIAARGAYPPEEALRAVQAVARIVAGVHQTGMIHRDMTPRNVIYDKAGGAAHLVDFGLARDLMVRERLTRTGELIGTPHYVSPEQAEGDLGSVDRRTDIYAMGAMLYRMLTGQVPFDGESVPQIVMKVLLEEVTPPRALDKRIPPLVEAICLKALAKEKDDRYHSAEALVADIDRYFAGQDTEARPLTMVGRGLKAAWRIRLLLGLGLVLLVFVLGLIVRYANRIRLMRAYRKAKIELFCAGGERSLEPPATDEKEAAWWDGWNRRLKAASRQAGVQGISWRVYHTDFPEEAQRLAQLKRQREALAMFGAVLDIDPDNARARKGLGRATEEIARLGAVELQLAQQMLARERTAGAVFYALRALRFAPQLPAEQVRQAKEILAGAQQSMRVTSVAPGLPVRIYRPEAPTAVDVDARTPFQTRRAGPLLFAVGPPADPFRFELLVSKGVRTLTLQHAPLPPRLQGWFRLATSRAPSESALVVEQAAVLRTSPLSGEEVVGLHERAGKTPAGGHQLADPRAPAVVPADQAEFLCAGLGGRPPTAAELQTWLRLAATAVAGPFHARQPDGAVAAQRWRDGRLQPIAGPAQVLLVLPAGKEPRAYKLWDALAELRSRLRAARKAEADRYEQAIAESMRRLRGAEAAAARGGLEKLAAEWAGPPPFRALQADRRRRRELLAWLAGAIGDRGALGQWLLALARRDQLALKAQGEKLDEPRRTMLARLFVRHGLDWYATREEAQARGALYFDPAAGRWLSPQQAERIGQVFAAGRWTAVEQAEAAGHGKRSADRWLAHDAAVAAGWAYQRGRGRWERIEQLWARPPKGARLAGSGWSVARVTAGNRLVLLSEGSLALRAGPEGKELWRIEIPSLSRNMWTAGDTVLVKYVDKLLLYRLRDGGPLGRITVDRDRPIALRPDGKWLAFGQGGKIRYQQVGGNETHEWDAPGGADQVSSLSFDEEGLLLGAGFEDGSLRTIAGRSRAPRETLLTRLGPIQQLRLLPGGISAAGTETRVWFKTGKQKPTELTGHGGRLVEMALFPGRRYMASSGTDRAIVVWQLFPTPRVIGTFRAGRFPTYSVAVSRDGDWIAGVTENGEATIWRP